MGEHPRLARAGAGENEQRTFAVGHGGALGLVQALQQGGDTVIGGGFRHDT